MHSPVILKTKSYKLCKKDTGVLIRNVSGELAYILGLNKSCLGAKLVLKMIKLVDNQSTFETW